MQLLRPKIDNAALTQELKIGPADNGRFKPSCVPGALGCSSPPFHSSEPYQSK